jgi:hypothetical protein
MMLSSLLQRTSQQPRGQPMHMHFAITNVPSSKFSSLTRTVCPSIIISISLKTAAAATLYRSRIGEYSALLLFLQAVIVILYRDSLGDYSPVPLVQPYYSCTPTVLEAINQSVGIGMGDASFYSAVPGFCLSPLIYLLLQVRDADALAVCVIFYCLCSSQWHGTPPVVEEYSKDEIDFTLREFATQLLRARDGAGEADGFRDEGALKALVDDLMYIAAHPRGFRAKKNTSRPNSSRIKRRVSSFYLER